MIYRRVLYTTIGDIPGGALDCVRRPMKILPPWNVNAGSLGALYRRVLGVMG